MTDDDTELCGSTDTSDGEPCELPGTKSDGRCHHHTDDEEKQARGGRPSKLEDRWDEIMAAAEEGLTYEGIARVAGIGRSTLDDWRREDDEFSQELERRRSVGERDLIQDADPEFVLERSYDYTKEQEIEHTGDGFDLSLSADEKEHLDELFDVDPQE